MRLLAVHQGGGLGGAPVSLLKLLARLDLDSHVVLTESGPILDLARQLHVPTTVVPTGGALYWSAHARLTLRGLARFTRTFPSAVRTAQRVIQTMRPTLIHLNTSVLLPWAAAARRERLPVVWVVREVLASPWQARFIQRHATRIVVISNAVRACFPPTADVRVVHNAIDFAEFTAQDRLAARRDLGLDPTEPVAMLIGSVQRAKGHWLLLDALAQMEAPPRVALVTGGVDETYASSPRGRLKHLLGMPLDNLDALLRDARDTGMADRLVVTGWRTDIPHVLSAADVLVFPSLAPEGFGRPIIEAMAMARPVVATDIGPSRELLGSDAGLLVPVEPRALANAIDSLMRDADCRRQMGEAGRRRAEALFGIDKQVAAMSAIYREAAGSG
jgi:glycosyltransferase involved in cell wall biosynthesis